MVLKLHGWGTEWAPLWQKESENKIKVEKNWNKVSQIMNVNILLSEKQSIIIIYY